MSVVALDFHLFFSHFDWTMLPIGGDAKILLMAMGRKLKRKHELSEPVVLIKSLTSRPWINRADPYSVSIMTASDVLVVTRVSPGAILPSNEDKGYGVFYIGEDTIERDVVLYSCEVEGVLSKKLIPIVQTEETTYVKA